MTVRRDIEAIVQAALERATQAERAAYLDGVCGGDADLRLKVDALLAAREEASGLLGAHAAYEAKITEGPGSRIGSCKLLQEIGSGGMGVVYMAEQERPVRRKVALKIIKLGMDTRQVIARFEAERQALALMDHPGIAKVLDAGATDSGRPYFVMELVRGISIHDYCHKQDLATPERLELFIDVCRAIQHAHQKGIIHRDIKPANVLVTSHDGKPVAKIIDFGVSKATHQRLTEKTLFTEFNQFIGTPEYMSPEQAEMSGLDVDTRTDIYALGVLLYELLTGTTPVDGRALCSVGYDELRRIIREDDPPTPSIRVSRMGQLRPTDARQRRTDHGALVRELRGDLDRIVMKAIEKDRTRRYATAAAMADDVQRHLDDQPVLAGAPGTFYRFAKFARRNRVSVLAGALVTVSVLIGLVLAATGMASARAEARRSKKISDTLQMMFAAVDPSEAASLGIDVDSVVRIAHEAFGDDHAAVAAALNSLAVQLQNAGNLAAAESLLREALGLWKSNYGDNHLNVGIAVGQLGRLLRMKGDDLAAEQALRESLRIVDSVPRPSIQVSSAMRLDLAKVLIEGRKFEEAETLLEGSLELLRAGPRVHLSVLETLSLLARCLQAQGEEGRMAEVWRELYVAMGEFYPAGSREMVTLAWRYGKWLYDQGRHLQAEPVLRVAVEGGRSSGEQATRQHVQTLDMLFQIVRARTDPASVAEADRVLEEILLAVPEIDGLWSSDTLLGNLGYLVAGRIDRGEFARATPVAAEMLRLAGAEGMDNLLEGLHLQLGQLATTVVMRSGQAVEDYESALRAARTGLEAWMATPVSDRGSTPHDEDYRAALAGALYRLGRIQEAEQELARLPEASSRGTQRAAIDSAFRSLVSLAAGDVESAGAHLRELRQRLTPELLQSNGLPALVDEVEAGVKDRR